ncbi:MAG: twin-arginine translocase TatA/TatE family subunit [Desulfovibrio sp.]|nr:twin-arginine translocase TatA/TatE family subunit [Desulfovibrio sp.]
MFGIGSSELLVILVVALIALGPKSLASVSRGLGKAVGEFRRVSTEFQRTLNAEADNLERREKKAARVETPSRTIVPDKLVDLPEDSPVARALANAKAEAESRDKTGSGVNS